MALLGTYIESRTIAGLTSAESTSYAHGLGASPDFAIVQFIQTLATSNTVAMISVEHNATNVTVRNNGNVTSPNLRIVVIQAHSIIR